MTSELSQLQRRALEALVRLFLSGKDPVSAIDWRQKLPGTLPERRALAASLMPQFVTGTEGDDFHRPTLVGLLEGHPLAAEQIGHVLGCLTKKLARKGDFHNFDRNDLQTYIASTLAHPDDMEDVRLDEYVGVIDVAGLGRYLNGSWQRPKDIEEVTAIKTAEELLELRHGQQETKREELEKTLHPNDMARRVLRVFGQLYNEHIGKSWAVTPRHIAFEETQLSIEGRRKALARLKDRGLAGEKRAGAFFPTSLGIEALEHAEVLNERLPLTRTSSVQAVSQSDLSVGDLATKLDFLKNDDPKQVVKQDLTELDSVLRARAWKASLLLCGSILEGILIDVLDRRRDIAEGYLKGKQKFPDGASLDDLLSIAAGQQLLNPNSVKAGIAIKDHRDLIHPHRQVREKIKVDKNAAGQMLFTLHRVVDDLNRASIEGTIQAYEDK